MNKYSKKITVLTHRLGPNYGGILQAYALQQTLKRVVPGAEIVTTHLQPLPSLLRRCIASLIMTLKRRRLYVSSLWVNARIQAETLNFLAKYVNYEELSLTRGGSYVVGSDQVWRAAYVDPIKYMFGDIKDDRVGRISYAASFGTDNLSEYTDTQIKATAQLAKKFNGISVREATGVEIVNKSWGVEADHHLDPTLLLEAKEYISLVDTEPTRASNGTLFVYVLDRNRRNTAIIDKIKGQSGMKPFGLLPKEYGAFFDFMNRRQDYELPKVEQWIRSFSDAEFVVTDSFHGTAFSIIFNKPFVAIGNEGRGLTRFTSLLKTFSLEDRLVSDVSEVTDELLESEIDWESVNAIKKFEQKRSMDYLIKHLG